MSILFLVLKLVSRITSVYNNSGKKYIYQKTKESNRRDDRGRLHAIQYGDRLVIRSSGVKRHFAWQRHEEAALRDI